MSYKKILENLKNLPESERLLAYGVYHFYNDDGKRECGCVLGKGVPSLFGKDGPKDSTENELGIEALLRYYSLASISYKITEGMTVFELSRLQILNDRFSWDGSLKNDLITRHARYIYIVDWLERAVARGG